MNLFKHPQSVTKPEFYSVISTLAVLYRRPSSTVPSRSIHRTHLPIFHSAGLSVGGVSSEQSSIMGCLESTATDISGVNSDTYDDGLGAGMVEVSTIEVGLAVHTAHRPSPLPTTA